MAITATESQNATSGWTVNAYSADASGCEEIKAAPGSGNRLELHRLHVNCLTAITVTIGAGESSGGVETTLAGPIQFSTTGPNYDIAFNPPILLADNKSLTVDSSGAGAVLALVQGKTV